MAPDTIELGVRGLHCGGCVARLTRVLEHVPGVARAEVSLLGASARVEAAPGVTLDRAAVVHAIEGAGYYAVEASPR